MLAERKQTGSYYQKGCELMPGGVNSPVRAFHGLSTLPLVVKAGKGDQIWDVDGNGYIDFCLAWGSLLLGHSPKEVVEAVTAQLDQGTSFGIATPYECDLASLILRWMPRLEKIRFVSSGTEATMTAVRLSRGFTGKTVIVKFDGHYHGHSDGLLVSAGSGVTHLPCSSSAGIPPQVLESTLSLPFNDIETFCAVLDSRNDIAAVILEPVTGNMGVVPGRRDFMERVRRKTAECGVVLIFDEVITGFRLGLEGAQGEYGIEPDLTCLGKIIGGGLPAAAVGGKRKIMDLLAPCGPVYQAGTLSGNPLAMVAGKAVLEVAQIPGFYADLQEKTQNFLAPIRLEILKRDLPMVIQSYGSMFTLFFGVRKVESRNDLAQLDVEKFGELFRFLLERGVYFSPSAYEAHFISNAHTQAHLDHVSALILEFLRR